MKKIFIYMMIVAALTTSCNKDDDRPDSNIGQMTLTTKLSNVSIQLLGKGTGTIDWGDNTPVETFNLVGGSNFDATTPLVHTYSDANVHLITIKGDNIIRLSCVNQGVLSVDVRKNPKLLGLNCDQNEISSLDVSRNIDLETFTVVSNKIAHLDFSKNTKLNKLNCSSNNLTTQALNTLFESLNSIVAHGETKELCIIDNPGTINCDRNIAEIKGWSLTGSHLITMTVEYQQVTVTMAGFGTVQIDWGDNSEIEEGALKYYSQDGWSFFNHEYADASPHTIIISGGGITWFSNINTGCTMLDVSKNPFLYLMSCADNRLTSLDISQNPFLGELYCYNNKLSSLDVSKNVALHTLFCNETNLTELDISSNIALSRLDCSKNNLTKLDVSHNISLDYLDCSGNKLSDLDLSKNVNLTIFACNSNLLTNLDVSANNKLFYFVCENNNLTSESLNEMFETLHNNDFRKFVFIALNPGVDDCDKRIAEIKGWEVLLNPNFVLDTSVQNDNNIANPLINIAFY